MKKIEKRITKNTRIKPSVVQGLKELTGEQSLSDAIEVLYENAKPVKQPTKKP